MSDARRTTISSTVETLASRAWSKRDWALVLIAPLILIGVAINHQVLTATKNLTAWKGGGFGMFATVDSNSTRRLVATPILSDGTEFGFFNIRDVLDTDETPTRSAKILAMPSQDDLRRAAEESIEFYRDVVDDPAIETDDIVDMRVEVVTLGLDSRTNQMTYQVIESVTVSAQ